VELNEYLLTDKIIKYQKEMTTIYCREETGKQLTCLHYTYQHFLVWKIILVRLRCQWFNLITYFMTYQSNIVFLSTEMFSKNVFNNATPLFYQSIRSTNIYYIYFNYIHIQCTQYNIHNEINLLGLSRSCAHRVVRSSLT